MVTWIYPPLRNGQHQDYYQTFSKESQPKPSFATVAGWGLDPNDHLAFQEARSLGRRRDCRGLKRLPVGGRLPWREEMVGWGWTVEVFIEEMP